MILQAVSDDWRLVVVHVTAPFSTHGQANWIVQADDLVRTSFCSDWADMTVPCPLSGHETLAEKGSESPGHCCCVTRDGSVREIYQGNPLVSKA